MNPEEFRKYGHQLIDWIADYRAHVEELPVRSQVQPGAVRARLPATPPQQPESFEGIFSDLEQIIVPGLSHFRRSRASSAISSRSSSRDFPIFNIQASSVIFPATASSLRCWAIT